jgi:hypothetical protein
MRQKKSRKTKRMTKPKPTRPNARQSQTGKGIRVPEQLCLRAAVVPSTYDPERGTVDIVWTTGAPVQRYDWVREQIWWEELEVSEKAIDLSRLEKGAPVLDSHNQWNGIRSVIGVVERAWIEGGKGLATVRFDLGDPVGREAARKIEAGILNSFSCGYKPLRWANVTTEADREAGQRRLRATRWQPYELSPVPIGADPDAQARELERSAPAEYPMDEDEVQNQGGVATIPPGGSTQQRQQPAPAAPNAAPTGLSALTDQERQALLEQGRALESQRRTQIEGECRRQGLGGSDFERSLVSGSLPFDQARIEILNHLAARQQTQQGEVGRAVHASVIDDERNKRRRGAEAALILRGMPSLQVDAQERSLARDFVPMSFLDMARDCVEAAGVRTRGMRREEIARAALARVPAGLSVFQRAGGGMTSSDFPLILGNVTNRVLAAAYAERPQVWREFCQIGNNPDFRPKSVVRLSDAPPLKKVKEGGEYQFGSLGETQESVALEKHGVVVGFSWEMIVNDDLDAFSSLVPSMGRRARLLEEELAFGVLVANAAMADGQNLFSVAHANTVASGSIDQAGLTAADLKLGLQKDIKGTPLNLTSTNLIVPLALRETANKYLQPGVVVVPTKGDDVNTFRGRLKVIASPILDANSATKWYMTASAQDAPVVHMAFLTGETGPTVTEDEHFLTDGYRLRIRHVLKAIALDWRGGVAVN